MESNLRKTDIILVLKPIEGKFTLSSAGLVDKRLFDKENANRLHLKMDPSSSLWSFCYDLGTLPPGLKGQYTSSTRAFNHAKYYLDKRNIEITEVLD